MGRFAFSPAVSSVGAGIVETTTSELGHESIERYLELAWER